MLFLHQVFFQILHVRPDHWITIVKPENEPEEIVYIFDSLHNEPAYSVVEQIACLVRTKSDHLTLKMMWCPEQGSGDTCGLHAIANLFEYLSNPHCFAAKNWKWNDENLRIQRKNSFLKNNLSSFPKSEAWFYDRFKFRQILFEYPNYCICR